MIKGVNEIKYPASTGHCTDIQSGVVIIIVTVNINDKRDVVNSNISGSLMQLDTPFYRYNIDLYGPSTFCVCNSCPQNCELLQNSGFLIMN